MNRDSRFISQLSLAGGLILPFAAFSSKGLAPLIAIVAVTAIVRHTVTRRSVSLGPTWLGAVITAFLALAMASALWSATPAHSFQAVWPTAGILFCALGLAGVVRASSAGELARAGTDFLIGFFVGVALLFIEAGLDRPIMRAGSALLELEMRPEKWMLKPAATVAAILFWPALILLHRKEVGRIWLWACATALVAMNALIGSDAAILGLVVGGVFFGMGLSRGRATGWFLGVAMAASIFAAPWLPGLLPDPRISVSGIEYLPNSAVHRIFIWQTTARHIHERPWLGHGFDTSRNMYPQSTSVSFSLPKQTKGGLEMIKGEPIPLHPHNMVLQVWLELGAAGAILLLATLLTILAAILRGPPEKMERAAGYGFFVTALVIACVSYGAWQAWWLSALGLCGAVFLIVSPREASSSSHTDP